MGFMGGGRVLRVLLGLCGGALPLFMVFGVIDRFRLRSFSFFGSQYSWLQGLVYGIPYVVHYWVRLVKVVCLGFNL